MPRLDFGNVSAPHLQRLIEAKAFKWGYQDQIEVSGPAGMRIVPNPESKQEFVIRRQREEWVEETKAIETFLRDQNAPPIGKIDITNSPNP